MKRITALIGGVALAAAAFVPLDQASAQNLASNTVRSGSKSVVKSDSGSYIVVMDANPLLASIPQDDLTTPAAEASGEALNASHDAVLAESGISTSKKVQDYTNALNGFSAVLSYHQAVSLAANPKVLKVLPDQLRHVTKNDDGNEGKHGAKFGNDVNKFIGLTGKGQAYASGITGEGVIVGVVDTGIWPEHPSFADDGTFPPHDPLDTVDADGNPLNPCNFGNTAANPNDAPFTCNNKLIGAREFLKTYKEIVGLEPDEFDSARDDEGHGTHTASTAAGDANVRARIFGKDFGDVTGIAPRAQVIAYKGLGNGGGFASDLAAAIDQAVTDGVDVINYSVGGGTDFGNADTIAYLFAARAGVFVATSAGNAGPGPETLGGPANAPWVTAVGANTQSRFFPADVRLDKGPTVTGASVTDGTGKLDIVDAEFAGTSDLCLPDTLDPAKVAGKIVLCRRGGNGRVDKSFSVFNAGGKGMILYNQTDDDNLFTDNFWVPTVHVDFTEGVQVKNYIASSNRPRAQIKPQKTTTIDYAPSMTIFSSRGPNPGAADVIKPDITAPGIQQLAGASPFTDAGLVPGELFQAIAGTSMSSPVVAGVFALLKQAHPDWSPAEAKSAIMGTADTAVVDNDRVTQAGPFAMGAGMVNPGIVAAPGSAFNPGLVYDAGFFDYLGFLCEAEPSLLSPTTCPSLAAGGIATTAENLNYPSIGIDNVAGTETVHRTVTSVASTTVTYTAAVNAPPGYDVSVDPSTITVPAGGTASFDVTVTNVGAPLGEFAFGDLTWNGSGYHVRSPIALQSVQLQAPAEVTGTGTEGSASFDIKFGYTGAYSAVAHGLVPATHDTGHLARDPDQTPFTADDDGGLVEIPFTIPDGTALVRWEMIVPATNDDIDLYLLDADGNIVAQSINGGTNETVELQLPTAGTYTMAVHAFSVPATGKDFDLSSWIVPLTTGGSLSISQAPTAAVSGETDTITVNWAGLTAGVRYIGAVSHNDDAGVISLTDVSVDA